MDAQDAQHAQHEQHEQHDQQEQPRERPESESPNEWHFKTSTGLVHNSEVGFTCDTGRCGMGKVPVVKGAMHVKPCNCTKAVEEQ